MGDKHRKLWEACAYSSVDLAEAALLIDEGASPFVEINISGHKWTLIEWLIAEFSDDEEYVSIPRATALEIFKLFASKGIDLNTEIPIDLGEDMYYPLWELQYSQYSEEAIEVARILLL